MQHLKKNMSYDDCRQLGDFIVNVILSNEGKAMYFDGYNLLLSTLEIENNMKLTIHEMIFQMHLEKQSYDKAVDEIKNVFNLMRIQMQKIKEAMEQIRRNALNYSVRDYEEILLENLDTISDTKQKFKQYYDEGRL